MSEKFSEKNKNRAIEFELYNPYGDNPRSLSSFLNNDFKSLNALSNNSNNATEVLKNTFTAPEFNGPKTIAGVNSRVEKGALILPSVNNQKLSAPASVLGVYLREVNETVPHKLAVNVLTTSVPKEPSNTPNIKGLRSISIGFPSAITSTGDPYKDGYPSNLLGAQEEGKTFIKKGDEINLSLTENSILNFSSTLSNPMIKPLKPGDELELTLSTEKRENEANGARFTDSNAFVNASDKITDLPNRTVKFKVTSVGDKSISLSSMEDVTVKAGHRYTLSPAIVSSFTKLYLNENWLNSKFGNKLVELFKNKDATAFTILDPKEFPEIAITLNYLRDGKVISSNAPYSKVTKDVNSIIGENATGTVKVRYVDESGKEIPGQKVETIAENQPWTNTVTITPKSIDGYTFVRSSVPLKTLVGSGEQVVDLVYKLIDKTTNPLDPNANTPIEETIIKEYKPNPKLDPGTQNIVDPGKPRKTQGDKVVDPGKPQVIEVGTKPKVVEEEIPFKETVVENPSKPEGSRTVLKEGKVGKKTTTTTYTLDPKTGKVTPNTTTSTTPPEDRLIEVGTGKNVNGDIVTEYVPDLELEPGKTKVVQNGTPEVKDVTGKVVTPGTPTIIHIGIKPKVVEENIPFEREYKDNPKLPEGVENVIQKGVNGKKVTTTTYTVDTKTGKVTSTDKVDETPVVNEIVERGTGKNITGEIVVNYVPDPELEPGKTKVVQEGTPEVKDVTGKVVTPGKPTIIHVGTKPKVVEEETPFKEETRENKDLPKGQTKVVQEGKVGKKTTTTTYEVDPKTGTVTPTEKVEETPAVNKITEIGTKEEAKSTPTPTSQTPAKPQVQEVKNQLPSTGSATSVALTLAGLSVMGLATTMVLKKKEN